MFSHIISEIGMDENLTASGVEIDLLMAMKFSKYAWQSVTEKTIRNCFRKSYFSKELSTDYDSDSTEICEDVVSKIESQLEEPGDQTSADDFISFDDDVIATEQIPEDEEYETDVEEFEGEEDEEQLEFNPVSTNEAANAMSVLKRFFFQENVTEQEQFYRF